MLCLKQSANLILRSLNIFEWQRFYSNIEWTAKTFVEERTFPILSTYVNSINLMIANLIRIEEESTFWYPELSVNTFYHRLAERIS